MKRATSVQEAKRLVLIRLGEQLRVARHANSYSGVGRNYRREIVRLLVVARNAVRAAGSE